MESEQASNKGGTDSGESGHGTDLIFVFPFVWFFVLLCISIVDLLLHI